MSDTKTATIADVAEPFDQVERERLLAEAEAEIEATGGTPHQMVLTWLGELAAGRESPPPCDR